MKNKLHCIVWLLLTFAMQAQKMELSSVFIPSELKENANSLVRLQEIDIVIKSDHEYEITTQKIITVFNENGLNNIDANEYYDASNKILEIEATVFNSFGNEIKKIKKKDFKDHSVADGFSIFTDNRMLRLDYTPVSYPFTVVYTSKKQSSNTAFIPGWYPIDDLYESVEKSTFSITYPSDLGFKFKEFNIADRAIVKQQTENTIQFTASQLLAEKNEEYGVSYLSRMPYVIFGLEKFSLEGVSGNATSWKDFGQWMYSSFLANNEQVSPDTQIKLTALIGTEKDPVKKAKLVYKFMQDKTRYVSVQMGIGGWKPMLSSDVDRLGYGDCKALSNYTRALLKSVGVTSYYTIIYGGEQKRSLHQDFVSMQGNHAVLAIPNEKGYYFLECTSQKKPFGYEGDFTDDRYALVVKPDGGELIKTNQFETLKSTQISKGSYAIDPLGNLSGTIKIVSKGIQYENVYELKDLPKQETEDYYKSHFRWINNLKLQKYKYTDDRDEVTFTEDLEISAANYMAVSGTTLMLNLNVFNQNNVIPQRYRNRKTNFEIDRGFQDVDEIEINISDQFKIDAKPENIEINSKFGSYALEYTFLPNNKILYKRKISISNGVFDKSEYEEYRKFKEQIAKNDNAKIVLSQK
jgi:transglutaminase-like putative cysteine protease